MGAKFEVYKDNAGEFRFRLKAGNGEIILSGEGYKQKSGCLNGIESVKKNSADLKRFETSTGKSGGYCFRLKAANGEIIGQGESYTSEAACKNGIESVHQNAPAAEIVEI